MLSEIKGRIFLLILLFEHPIKIFFKMQQINILITAVFNIFKFCFTMRKKTNIYLWLEYINPMIIECNKSWWNVTMLNGTEQNNCFEKYDQRCLFFWHNLTYTCVLVKESIWRWKKTLNRAQTTYAHQCDDSSHDRDVQNFGMKPAAFFLHSMSAIARVCARGHWPETVVLCEIYLVAIWFGVIANAEWAGKVREYGHNNRIASVSWHRLAPFY